MIIIIEGTNYSGKTFLAKKLETKTLPIYKGFKSLGIKKQSTHKTISKNGTDFLLFDFIAQVNKANEISFINDRSFFSEIIYNNKSFLLNDFMELIGKVSKNQKVLIIFLIPNKATIQNNFVTTDFPKVLLGQAIKINEKYKKLSKEIMEKKMKNTEIKEFENSKEALKWIKKRA